jgi:hypothetical protein
VIDTVGIRAEHHTVWGRLQRLASAATAGRPAVVPFRGPRADGMRLTHPTSI